MRPLQPPVAGGGDARRTSGHVRLLRHPVGILAEASGRPYGLVVIQRGAGMLPACTPNAEEFDQELDAASAWLARGPGARVAVDASSLHLSANLGTDDFFGPLQARRVLPRASKHDIQITLLEARQLLSSPGTVT